MDEPLEFDELLSNCCYAKVYADTDICSDCGETCEIVEPETI